MKIHAFIYCRLNSSRLPGKVLFTIGQRTILQICVDKVKAVPGVVPVVLTSDRKTDDPIAEACASMGVACFRGDLDNLVQRTLDCLEQFPCDGFFRLNADSPFFQPSLYAQAQEVFQSGKYDLVTNILQRSYPYGIAVELLRSNILKEHFTHFVNDDFEHLTKYFYREKHLIRIFNIQNEADWSGFRFVLDTTEDWNRLQDLWGRHQNLFDLDIKQLIEL